jgi:hypothetical protein
VVDDTDQGRRAAGAGRGLMITEGERAAREQATENRALFLRHALATAGRRRDPQRHALAVRIGALGELAGLRSGLPDDVVAALVCNHFLDVRNLMAGHERELVRLTAQRCVRRVGDMDPLGASQISAFADNLEVWSLGVTADIADGFVDLAKECFVQSYAPLTLVRHSPLPQNALASWILFFHEPPLFAGFFNDVEFVVLVNHSVFGRVMARDDKEPPGITANRLVI